MNYDYDYVLVSNKSALKVHLLWSKRTVLYMYIYCILHLPLSIDILHCDKKVVKLLSRDPIHLNGFEPSETELTELNKVTEIL